MVADLDGSYGFLRALFKAFIIGVALGLFMTFSYIVFMEITGTFDKASGYAVPPMVIENMDRPVPESLKNAFIGRNTKGGEKHD